MKVKAIIDRFHPSSYDGELVIVRSDNPCWDDEQSFDQWCEIHGAIDDDIFELDITDTKSLEEAVGQILVQLTPANIMDIQEVTEEFSMICLNGLAIRNDWNLWWRSELSIWFYNHGIYHADDMSGVICKAVWCAVKSVPFNFEKEVKGFEEYWAETNSDVKGEFEKRCNL